MLYKCSTKDIQYLFIRKPPPCAKIPHCTMQAGMPAEMHCHAQGQILYLGTKRHALKQLMLDDNEYVHLTPIRTNIQVGSPDSCTVKKSAKK